jgi:hypothetical protein
VKFVLVVVVILTDAVTSPPTVTAVDFNSEAACLEAARGIESTVTKMQANTLVTAQCFDKGG